VIANPIMGAVILSIGGCSSALCYTPQKKTRAWSWQSYWLAQALVCWFILPWLGAWITTPHLMAVLSEAPTQVMMQTMLLGLLFGIGGTAFGVAIRYLGFSLTYAVAIGISCVVGTLFTPLLSGELAALLVKTGTGWVLFRNSTSPIRTSRVSLGAWGGAGRLDGASSMRNGSPSWIAAPFCQRRDCAGPRTWSPSSKASIPRRSTFQISSALSRPSRQWRPGSA